MLKFDELPSVPLNDRIMVLPDPPPDKTEGGLAIPDVAQKQAAQGRIVDAGLKAHDILYDGGDRVGDFVLYGQFAGVWEEWDHLVKEGSDPDCEHDWVHRRLDNSFRRQGRECARCGAHRLQEPVLVMNVGDIQCNVSKAARVRSGELVLLRGQTIDGKTVHYYARRDEQPATDTTANPTNGVNYAA